MVFKTEFLTHNRVESANLFHWWIYIILSKNAKNVASNKSRFNWRTSRFYFKFVISQWIFGMGKLFSYTSSSFFVRTLIIPTSFLKIFFLDGYLFFLFFFTLKKTSGVSRKRYFVDFFAQAYADDHFQASLGQHDDNEHCNIHI